MVELREETGVQRSLTERLARSRLQWAWHVERMADDRLPKIAAELREQGRRRRGRPRLRWEDCVKRDVRKAGEEEDWKKKTRDRGGWKRLSDEMVKKLPAAPDPWQRENEEERVPTKKFRARPGPTHPLGFLDFFHFAKPLTHPRSAPVVWRRSLSPLAPSRQGLVRARSRWPSGDVAGRSSRARTGGSRCRTCRLKRTPGVATVDSARPSYSWNEQKFLIE